jgi:hypothetical protein
MAGGDQGGAHYKTPLQFAIKAKTGYGFFI